MNQVDTLCVGRYRSEVLCCTITPYLGDLEVKINHHRLRNFVLKFLLKFYKSMSLAYVDGSS